MRTDRTGGVTTVFALSLPAIVGFAGLGAEAASWYLTKRTMQGAADTAASAAATALSAGTTSLAALTSEARSIAARSNFVNGSNGTTVTVNNPYGGDPNKVEVSISKPQPALLSALFLAHGPTIAARAVARADLSYEACVIALDKNNETAMTTSGSPNLSFPGCSLYANSPASAALNMNGSAIDQCEQGILCRQLQRGRPDDRQRNISRRRSDHRPVSEHRRTRIRRLQREQLQPDRRTRAIRKRSERPAFTYSAKG